MSGLFEKLQGIRDRYDTLALALSQPDVLSDQKKYIKLSKEYKELGELVAVYQRYRTAVDLIREADQIVENSTDLEMRALAQAEKEAAEARLPNLEAEIKRFLIPKNPEDDKDAIVEIRAGTGGDESAIFVADMFRMYTLYFAEKGWQFEVLNSTEGGGSGFKELVMRVSGDDIYGTLKFESGVHRVQRVPETESQGRIHTSAVTVAVLPEAQEIDVAINPSDIRKDTFRSSGAGGQHVNKTESAIRLTHIPTGIVVECQDGRSQHKNYDKALQVLRARLYQIELEKAQSARAQQRRSLVSTGDRSAKIRTYNYPQGRVTDHRINQSIYDLPAFMKGDIEGLIQALKMAENAEKLHAAGTPLK
ncbi:MAG: peptide chain release factor 1 [Flavobacteriales bacterium]